MLIYLHLLYNFLNISLRYFLRIRPSVLATHHWAKFCAPTPSTQRQEKSLSGSEFDEMSPLKKGTCKADYSRQTSMVTSGACGRVHSKWFFFVEQSATNLFLKSCSRFFDSEDSHHSARAIFTGSTYLCNETTTCSAYFVGRTHIYHLWNRYCILMGKSVKLSKDLSVVNKVFYSFDSSLRWSSRRFLGVDLWLKKISN